MNCLLFHSAVIETHSNFTHLGGEKGLHAAMVIFDTESLRYDVKYSVNNLEPSNIKVGLSIPSSPAQGILAQIRPGPFYDAPYGRCDSFCPFEKKVAYVL